MQRIQKDLETTNKEKVQVMAAIPQYDLAHLTITTDISAKLLHSKMHSHSAV
jgi:hypothetical protein